MLCCYLFCGQLVIVKRPRMTFYTLRQLEVHQTDFTLLVRQILIDVDNLLFWFVVVSCLFFYFLFFFTTVVVMSGRWDFSIEMLLSTCVVLLWLNRFNNFDTHSVFLVSIYIYIYKHDAYTVLFVPKLGFMVTNHMGEFYGFNYYWCHSCHLCHYQFNHYHCSKSILLQ